MVHNSDKDKRVSEEAVQNATGKGWNEWFEVLDKVGAAKLGHTRIAGYLRSQHEVKPWWSQMVANTYEKKRGLRAAGQTTADDFQIGVRRTLPVGTKKAWDLLTRPGGLEVWLGECPDFRLEKGFKYETADGVTGEVRVVSLGSHWRMGWKPNTWSKSSTLQVRLLTAGDKTTISFHHDGLPDGAAREAMRQRWQQALIELEELV